MIAARAAACRENVAMAPGGTEGRRVADAGLAAWLEALRAGRGAGVRPAGPALAAVTDLPADGALVARRLYRPVLAARALVVYLHGGAWAGGDLDTHDRTCRRLAAGADVCVLAVDFRRPPEHPWPAAVDDAVAVFRWAAERRGALGAAECPIGVAGDSSGGMLAALSCLWLRDRDGPCPHAQLLAYPNTDLTFSRPSIAELGTGWGVDVSDLRRDAEQWVPDAALRAGAASPLSAPDLRGLPAALVVTAELDPLRDEGDAYAGRLRQAGVPVVHRCEPGMVHGFLQGVDLVSAAAAAASARFFAAAGRLMRADPAGPAAADRSASLR
jgi:acetyl esterase/lipase